MRIRTKLIGLGCLFVAGFGSFWFVSQRTLEFSSVGGPAYESVVEGKDLVADILPPPAYIIESQLNAMELQSEADAGARVIGSHGVLETRDGGGAVFRRYHRRASLDDRAAVCVSLPSPPSPAPLERPVA